MKRIILLIVVTVLLAACAANPSAPAANQPVANSASAANEQAVSSSTTASELNTDFADAANVRNQLAYGTLKLEGTDQGVSAEQAKTLLPLWQAMLALSGNSSSSPEELTAVQDQITAAMQPEQLSAIADYQITNAQLASFYAVKGIVLPTPVPGVTKVPGSGQNISEEARQATRTAREASGTVATGAGQAAKTLLFEEVVKLLSNRSAE